VQAAREAARKLQCQNNLKQIGLALHDYHDAHGIFPPGAFADFSDYSKSSGSILIRLLPFLEQTGLYDMFRFTGTTTLVDDQRMPGSSKLIQSTPVATYTCPSDPRPQTVVVSGRGEVAMHNYAASIGPTKQDNSPYCPCVHDSWDAYAPPPWGGSLFGSNFAGPFWREGLSTSVADCKDGLSNTIYFGEVLPMWSGHQQQGWATSNNGQGLTSTLPPINYDTSSTNAADGCLAYCNWNMELGFKSLHPGGAGFLFGDGSVQFLSETIDHWTYQYLGAKADGHVAQVP
jgi:prepilin-type processing-associated H-X9-DG protein